jgi:hypothetical protein
MNGRCALRSIAIATFRSGLDPHWWIPQREGYSGAETSPQWERISRNIRGSFGSNRSPHMGLWEDHQTRLSKICVSPTTRCVVGSSRSIWIGGKRSVGLTMNADHVAGATRMDWGVNLEAAWSN